MFVFLFVCVSLSIGLFCFLIRKHLDISTLSLLFVCVLFSLMVRQNGVSLFKEYNALRKQNGVSFVCLFTTTTYRGKGVRR